MRTQNPLVGKIVREVYLTDDGGAIKFVLLDDSEIIARADGDCCSHSWIEEIQGLEQLIGSTITLVEDLDLPAKAAVNHYGHFEEVMAYYGCKITTEKGYAVIDYRNSSNGYYGGNLSWGDSEYFYGGVYGQNASTMVWQRITQ